MNKFNKLAKGIYKGEFNNVPSRSGRADVTVLLNRFGVGFGSLFSEDANYGTGIACTMVYEHHEDTTMYVDTAENLVAYFQDLMLTEYDPEWSDGIGELCLELERIISEFKQK